MPLYKAWLLSLISGLILSGCTVTIMLTHSNGTDNDVEATPTTEAKTDANVSVPAIP